MTNKQLIDKLLSYPSHLPVCIWYREIEGIELEESGGQEYINILDEIIVNTERIDEDEIGRKKWLEKIRGDKNDKR
jgi:hypothetical protein